jgi:hypothetical protein
MLKLLHLLELLPQLRSLHLLYLRHNRFSLCRNDLLAKTLDLKVESPVKVFDLFDEILIARLDGLKIALLLLDTQLLICILEVHYVGVRKGELVGWLFFFIETDLTYLHL